MSVLQRVANGLQDGSGGCGSARSGCGKRSIIQLMGATREWQVSIKTISLVRHLTGRSHPNHHQGHIDTLIQDAMWKGTSVSIFVFRVRFPMDVCTWKMSMNRPQRRLSSVKLEKRSLSMMVSKIILILLVVSRLVHKPTSIPSAGRLTDGYIVVALAAWFRRYSTGKNQPMLRASAELPAAMRYGGAGGLI